MERQEYLNEISALLQKGRMPKVKELVKQALEAGVSPKEILEEGLLSGMSVIGEKFKNNEVFVPEVLIAARAMNGGVEILKPYLVEAGVETKGVVVIGTVKGDLHDIGKNLVKMMMGARAWKWWTWASTYPPKPSWQPPRNTMPISFPALPCSPPPWVR